MQIADYFCQNILSREWKANERIPSVREIAVLVEVNPNTAMRAFNFLQDQGIIQNRRGIGYFVDLDGYTKALELRKNAFIRKEVPAFFKTMHLLNLTCADLEKLYNETINK